MSDDYTARVLTAQAKSGRVDGKLGMLLNRRVAGLNGCEF